MCSAALEGSETPLWGSSPLGKDQQRTTLYEALDAAIDERLTELVRVGRC